MVKEGMVADAMYATITPRDLSRWEGCNKEPYSLSRHLAATDVLLAVITIEMREWESLSMDYRISATQFMEDVVYELLGFPKCWKEYKNI